MNSKENPAPWVNTEGRVEHANRTAALDSTTGEAALGYAAGYIANRFGVSFSLAALLARLAELGGALA